MIDYAKALGETRNGVFANFDTTANGVDIANITKRGNNANILHGMFVNYFTSADTLCSILHNNTRAVLRLLYIAENATTCDAVSINREADEFENYVTVKNIGGEISMSVLYTEVDMWRKLPTELVVWGMFQNFLCTVITDSKPVRLTILVHAPYVMKSDMAAINLYLKTVSDNVREVTAMGQTGSYSISGDITPITNLTKSIKQFGNVENVVHPDNERFLKRITPAVFGVDGYRYINANGAERCEEFEP